MSLLIQLFLEFFKIGLFAVGGGLATIPLLHQLAEKYTWFSVETLVDMIAISESTPGPIGINMATYVGYHVAGIWGGIVATMGEILPAIVIVVIVSKYLEKFRGSRLVDAAFYGLRPAVTGLIAAAGISVVQVSILRLDLFRQTGALLDLFDFKKLLYFAVVFFAIKKFKKHPIVYIAISAVVGILLAF